MSAKPRKSTKLPAPEAARLANDSQRTPWIPLTGEEAEIP